MARAGMRTPGDHDLVEQLNDITARALAVTMGDPTAAMVDESALLAELSAATNEILSRAEEMASVLDHLAGALQTALANAPEPSKQAAHKYTISMLKWQPDPPAMPRMASAFVVCDRLQSAAIGADTSWRMRATRSCAHGRPLRLRSKDPCVVLRAPTGSSAYPARLNRSAVLCNGLPLQCSACGQKWFEHEANDDMGAVRRGSWRRLRQPRRNL